MSRSSVRPAQSALRTAAACVAGLALACSAALPALAQNGDEQDSLSRSAAAAEPSPPADADTDGLSSTAAPPITGDSETGLWVVQLAEPPLATYEGGIEGLAPTSPRVTGEPSLDVDAPASRAYQAHLEERQADVASGIEAALDRPVEAELSFTNVLNGMAVEVSRGEAETLAAVEGVAAVFPDTIREMDTDVSHEIIQSAGVWSGSTGTGTATRGEGVIVGMIDSGVNPFHPSFAATDGDGYTHTNPFGSGNFVGVCDPAHPQHDPICNDKLIGAWNFNPASPSARDADSHGSHVGSTIAGNVHEAEFTIGTDTFTRTVQGVAPRANVISYLVCSPGCPGSATVAAVDQAIADGVDVLNYSISGIDNPWLDPVDLAFLDAHEAGIVINASAGNDGPNTVAKTGPWNASVAATTHHRVFAHTVSVTAPEPIPPAATDLPATPGDGPQVTADIDAEVRFATDNPLGCTAFPAGTFTGAIALIERGTCTFQVKVENATAAGAIAVVIYNNVGGPPSAPGGLETTAVPAVMITNAGGLAVREAIAASDPTLLHIDSGTAMYLDDDWADVLAGFSSTGPSQFEMLAPTYAAPGVNILAAAAADGADADQYAVLGGTSMASPHGAGAAALLVALHPEWSPSMVRSALAGTADSEGLTKPDASTPADPFDIGSGRINVAEAGRVGLVLDETHANFVAANPSIGGDPKTLNLPAMVSRDCADTCSWERTVTSVADTSASYTVEVDAPAGMALTVTPSSFSLAPGATQDLTIEADVTGLPIGDWAFARVTLATGAAHSNGEPVSDVELPVATLVADAPGAVITLDPPEVSSTQGPDEVRTETLTIGNAGVAPLEWEFVDSATGVSIHRQENNGGSGIISDFFNTLGGGTYAADDFTVADGTTVDSIHTPGFWNGGSLANATAISWYLYPDAGGQPAGHPEDGQDQHVWTHTAPPTGTGVDITDNSITLDVAAATGSGVDLEAGTYWLSVFPSISTTPASRWNWYQGTPQGAQAHLVDPVGAFGGFPWTPFGGLGLTFTDLAFELQGSMTCEMPSWLSVDPTSGTVEVGGSTAVSVEFDSTGLADGVHDATLCVESNDQDNPVALVPVTLEVGAAQAALTLDPEELSSTQGPGAVVDQSLTIGNTGGSDLEWEVLDDVPGGPVVLNHSTSDAITVGNSVACSPDGGLTTNENGYLRVFDLDALGVSAFDVSEVTFGVENASSAVTVAVNLFTMVDPDGPLTYANLELLETTDHTVPAGQQQLVTVPISASVPAGATLVAEVDAPDLSGVAAFFIGSNSSGQSAPSYLRSVPCGLPNPTDTAAIGIPGMHIVMSVTGTVASLTCDAPADTPWFDLEPQSGTVAPGAEQELTATFDSTGLAAGTYTATLCLGTNDPANPTVTVPVSLVVDAAPVITVTPDSFEVTQESGTVTEHELTIGNDGDAVLDWSVNEAEAEAEAAGNGPAARSAAPDLPVGTDRAGAPEQGLTSQSRALAAPTDVEPASVGLLSTGLTEGFADVTVLPGQGWSMTNNSQPPGATTWFQGNDSVFGAHEGESTSYIAANYQNHASVGTISNWLLTPELPLGDGDTLSFWTRAPEGSPFPDRLEVRLSTAGDSTDVGATPDSVGDFDTLLLSVNPDLQVGGYPEEWTAFSATLEDLPAGATGRVAFRYFVTNGGPAGTASDYIGIDTVAYTPYESCNTPVDLPWLGVDPASGSTEPGGSSGVTVSIDASGLAPGEYDAQLCVESNDPVTPRVVVPVALTVTEPAPTTCFGLEPTIVGTGGGVVNGTSRADVILVDDADYTINGGAGDDRICTGDGDNTINGGAGGDWILTGDGNNHVDGGAGHDTISTGSGDDTVQGGAGNDIIDAGDGNNQVDGGAGNDTISAGTGDDRLDGAAGNDTIDAGDGNNLVRGHAGNDTITTGSGDDVIYGAAGNDVIRAGGGDDMVFGDAGNDRIYGEDGDDDLFGGPGNDIIDGGAGNNRIDGGPGRDTCSNGSATSCETVP